MDKILTKEMFDKTMKVDVQKALSRESRLFQWTETLIEKYIDVIDWDCLSENSEVAWNASILEKYKDKINWEKLSQNRNGEKYYQAKLMHNETFLKNRIRPDLFSTENLRRFADYWHWDLLSGNDSVRLSVDLIDEYKDKLDWKRLINHIFGQDKDLDFCLKYQDYIPVPELFDSALWRRMVRQKGMKIMNRSHLKND